MRTRTSLSVVTAVTAAVTTAGVHATLPPAGDRPGAVVDPVRVLTGAQVVDLERRAAAAFERVAPAVVRIYPHDARGGAFDRTGAPVRGSFSGVIIDADGTIVTCAHHGLPPRTAFTAELGDGRRARGTLLGRFAPGDKPGHHPDLGLARLDGKGPWPAAPPTFDAAPAGAACAAVGYPGTLPVGRPPLLRLGRVLAGRPDWPLVESSTTYEPGDSGGPLFDLDGRLLGVVHGGESFGPTLYQPLRPLRDEKARERLAAGEVIRADGPELRHRRLQLAHRAAFTPALDLEDGVARARNCTVEVLVDGRTTALGLVVAADGYVVTKRTLVDGYGELTCRTATGRVVPGRVAARSLMHDLCLIKLDAGGLDAATWADAAPAVGRVVASVGPVREPTRFGVVGGRAAHSPPPYHDLPQIPLVVGPPPAGRAGLAVTGLIETTEADPLRGLFRPGDVLAELGGTPTPTMKEFGEVMSRLLYAPGQDVPQPSHGSFAGEPVDVTVVRDGKPVRLRIHRVHAQVQHPLSWYHHPLSVRRDGFPAVFPHDAVVPPERCGGPVVDSDGRVLGLNVARADRTRTLAIPVDTLREVVTTLTEDATR